MFIHKETGDTAFIVNHDGDVIYSATADRSEPHATLPSFDFFDQHREATPEEIDGVKPAKKIEHASGDGRK